MCNGFCVLLLLLCCVMCTDVEPTEDYDTRIVFPQDGHENGQATDYPHPVVHAALPRGLAAHPLPLKGSEHELAFNVTWDPPVGPMVREYSIEVHSVTSTWECQSNLCYESNIPGDVLWSVIPTFPSPVPDGCAVRPGCAYRVKLIAHPWDGHTAANVNVRLDECVAGVCSCAHAPRLPKPVVSATVISIRGQKLVNVTWSLPPPDEPRRLPPRLAKLYYSVSVGKQMVTDAHPAPWFGDTISRRVNASGVVAAPDGSKWLVLPTTDWRRERSSKQQQLSKQSVNVDLKLLARVNLIDERGCVGPPGNASAIDRSKTVPDRLKSILVWLTLCCACVVMTLLVLTYSARMMKTLLGQFRPAASAAAAPAPLQPLHARSAWFQITSHREVHD